MIIPKFPSKEQIAKVIKDVEAIQTQKAINKRKNLFAKESMQFCLDLLNDRYTNPANPYFDAEEEGEIEAATKIYRQQLISVKELKTERGKAIAILCINWLNGIESNFLNFKL